MERINKEITNYKSSNISENELNEIYINNENFYFPDDFYHLVMD